MPYFLLMFFLYFLPYAFLVRSGDIQAPQFSVFSQQQYVEFLGTVEYDFFIALA